MHIVMVSHYFESHRGGVEIVAGQLSRALTLLGHQVVWIASDCDPPPHEPAICRRAAPLPASNWLERRTGLPYPVPLPSAARRIENEVRQSDAVLLQDGCYLPCLLARWSARRVGRPVVLMQHIGIVPYRNPLLRSGMAVLNRLLTKPALATADQVVFISELTRKHFSDTAFRRAPLLLFNGVDSAVFAPAPPGTDRGKLRRSLGLDPDRPVLLFVGRFVEKKGLQHLNRMARRRPDWTWLLAGWGPIDPLRWRLENVRVFSDRSGPTLAPLYHAADALVLPSVGEGFPLVIQEALACGLPVVCGDETATADPAAQRFLTGVPVRMADPDATAAAFIAALLPLLDGDQAGVEPHTRAAFARARYSWESMARSLLAVIASLRADGIEAA
jgi:glycosyltransferase involved in cell wall biosynthesis